MDDHIDKIIGHIPPSEDITKHPHMQDRVRIKTSIHKKSFINGTLNLISPNKLLYSLNIDSCFTVSRFLLKIMQTWHVYAKVNPKSWFSPGCPNSICFDQEPDQEPNFSNFGWEQMIYIIVKVLSSKQSLEHHSFILGQPP